jgi:hypothetical protein
LLYIIQRARHQWLTPVILATQWAEIRRIVVWSQPRQRVRETLFRKRKPFIKKGWWSDSRCRPWDQAPVLQKKRKKIKLTLAPFSSEYQRWKWFLFEKCQRSSSQEQPVPNMLLGFPLQVSLLWQWGGPCSSKPSSFMKEGMLSPYSCPPEIHKSEVG